VIEKNLEACQVSVGLNLRHALEALERGGVEIALVVDDDRCLVGR